MYVYIYLHDLLAGREGREDSVGLAFQQREPLRAGLDLRANLMWGLGFQKRAAVPRRARI